MFNKSNYQSSVFIDDINKIDNVLNELNDNGYKALALKDTLVESGITEIIRIMKAVVTIILVVVLFFISYFVVRVILKSRNKYFSTIRMLGANRNVSKQLLVLELLTVSNIAYFSFILMLYLNHIGTINIGFMNTINTYLKLNDYIILYVILLFMSYLISQKYAKKLFKKSAMTTFGEEV